MKTSTLFRLLVILMIISSQFHRALAQDPSTIEIYNNRLSEGASAYSKKHQKRNIWLKYPNNITFKTETNEIVEFDKLEKFLFLDLEMRWDEKPDNDKFILCRYKITHLTSKQTIYAEYRIGANYDALDTIFYTTNPVKSSWPKKIRESIFNHVPIIGMTKEQAILSLGNPDDSRRYISKTQIREVYDYYSEHGSVTQLTFVNNSLISISE